MTHLAENLDALAAHLFDHVVSHNFQGKPKHTDYLLMISEIIELFEDERNFKTESDKLPGFTVMEEELADLIIRALTVGYEHKCRITEAVIAKDKFNRTRPSKHGKAF